MANLWLTGSGEPTTGVGSVSDYYRDTVTNLVYYRENPTTWVVVPAFTPNPDGVGTTWIHGTGAPLNTLGSDTNYYYDDADKIVYYKDAGTWAAKGSLDFIGVYGVQWGNGSGAPANTPQLNNLPASSFYLDVLTSDIYFKNLSLQWELKGQLGGGTGGSVTVVDNLTSTSTTDALSAAQGKVLNDALANKCPLDISGKVPSANLPSYVDDVVEYANLAAFPVTGETGKIYVAIDTDAIYRWSGSAYFSLGSSGGGFGIREDVTITAVALADNANLTGIASIASRYQLLQITTNHPCRISLYTSTAKRDADLTRPIGTDPTGNHSLMFEFISTASLLSADLSPIVDGFSNTSAVAYTITNLSGATQTISVTLNHVKTGA